MPLLNAVTTPYAEAFLQVAEAAAETDVVIVQARSLLDLWSSSEELREVLGSPVLEVDFKKALIVRLFAEQVSPTFLNLLKLLADRKRIGILGPVLERLLEIHREQNNIALATITSATPLSDSQQALVSERVKSVAGTDKVEINVQVDPSLIGGFVLNVGSKVIDASLSGQVRRLGLELARVS